MITAANSKATGKREACTRHCLAGPSGADRHLLDPAELHLVHHLREQTALRGLVGDHDHRCRRAARCAGARSIGRTSRRSTWRRSIQISPFGRIAIRMLPLSSCTAVCASGLLDRDARLAHERGRDDEEDQQVHARSRASAPGRCRVFAGVTRCGGASASLTSTTCRRRRCRRRPGGSDRSPARAARPRRSARLVTITPQSGFCACSRSTLARTARASTRRPSTSTSPVCLHDDGDAAGLLARRAGPPRRRRGAPTWMPDLLHEDGGDDEEDQQVQDEVEHRREVDAGGCRRDRSGGAGACQ